MKHSGRARQAAFRLIFWTFLLLIAVLTGGLAAWLLLSAFLTCFIFLVCAWAVFAVFTLYFFRDPTARVPAGADLILSPAHGKVDMIDRVEEPLFMGGPCQRVSIFLSVFDVHVQKAPVSGSVKFYQYNVGEFLSALKTESAERNENLLLGIEPDARAGVRLGVRLIAGVLARRIVPFINEGEALVRGDRISLIQFGSRTDVYLPLSAVVKVKLGDRVVGGETVVAEFA